MDKVDLCKAMLPFNSAGSSIRANTPVGREGRFVRDVGRYIRHEIYNRGFRNVSLSIREVVSEVCEED